MVNSTTQTQEIFSIHVDETSKAHMLETAKWAKFISWVLIVVQSLMIGFTFIASLANGFEASQFFGDQMGNGIGLVLFVLYLFIILLFFYPLICLLQFSRKIKPALLTGNQQLFNESFKKLKHMFKFFGVVIILFLVVYGIFMMFLLLSLIGNR